MTTRWRSNGESPDSYDPGVVGRVGERVRDQLVDFEWPLNSGELKRLRRAAYSWGRPVAKQFKKFDAQIIRAINKVVPPPAPGMFRDLKVPAGCADIDSEGTVVREGDGFRVVGHASF